MQIVPGPSSQYCLRKCSVLPGTNFAYISRRAKSYTIYPGKPAWRWIEAAAAANLTSSPPAAISTRTAGCRQDAVDLLIRCLDLYEYALSVPHGDTHLASAFQGRNDTSKTGATQWPAP